MNVAAARVGFGPKRPPCPLRAR